MTEGRDRPAPWSPRQRSRWRGREREPCLVRSKVEGELRRPSRRGVSQVSPRREKMNARCRLSPTKEGSGGWRATAYQAREPGRPSEARSLRKRAKKEKKRRAKAVSAKRLSADGPEHQTKSGRAERPRVYAVAEPAATPEDRQSERSEVCRDRAKEKYKMPEGRACRREAVVRPAPEAGREALRGGRARMPSGRRGGAQPGPDGRWHPRGRAGENGAAGGAPSRQGATPRRDPGDCNTGRQPNRSVKRAHCPKRTGKPRTCGLEKKTPREDQQGRCRSLGQRKGPATPLPERGRENAGAVTGLEQRNALARPLLPLDGAAGGKSPIGG